MHTMRDPFFKKLEQHVAGMFEAVRAAADLTGEQYARTPYTGELFSTQHDDLLPHLEQTVCRALAFREAFRETAPHWAPELPLSSAEYEKMIVSKNAKIALAGHYARSLACANWGPHPSFHDYCCGVMAYEFTPSYIRTDPALLKEFPPRELPEFDHSLCWGTHKRIFEFTHLLMKNEEIWRRCG